MLDWLLQMLLVFAHERLPCILIGYSKQQYLLYSIVSPFDWPAMISLSFVVKGVYDIVTVLQCVITKTNDVIWNLLHSYYWN